MKPLSLIALFISAALMFVGFAGRHTNKLLSNAVIVGASFIIVVVVVVWIVAFLKKDRK